MAKLTKEEKKFLQRAAEDGIEEFCIWEGAMEHLTKILAKIETID